MRDSQISSLKVFSDYTNPDGNLSFVELNQEINGVPVFRGEVKAGFTRNGEMGRVINNLAPGLEYASLSTDFGDPSDAVRYSAANIKHELKQEETIQNRRASTDLKAVFGSGDWATTAEKMYFPTEPACRGSRLACSDMAAGKRVLRDRRRTHWNGPLAQEPHRRSDAGSDVRGLRKSECDDQRCGQSGSIVALHFGKLLAGGRRLGSSSHPDKRYPDR
jgi:hypothetical protein